MDCNMRARGDLTTTLNHGTDTRAGEYVHYEFSNYMMNFKYADCKNKVIFCCSQHIPGRFDRVGCKMSDENIARSKCYFE